MRFEKWQALGNDYVIVERETLPWKLTAERVRAICEPHFGIGSDGLLLLSRLDGDEVRESAGDAESASQKPGDEPVAELRIFNPDGSEAELSGNGAREAVLYLRKHGWTDRETFTVRTAAGDVRPTIDASGTVSMQIGRASFVSDDYPSGGEKGVGVVESAGREWRFQHVNVGNPQCVIDVGDAVEDLDLSEVGPSIEASELFPNRTNVSFVRIHGSAVRARIYERGVGETLSSGTGASGAAVAAFLSGSPSPITVRLDGGELTVEITEDLDITLIGTAEPVYSGELSPELLERLG